MSRSLVLVVDDDRTVRTVLHYMLEDWGYRVRTAADGGSLAIALAEQPNLILLDVNMPGMDGVQISRHLRARPETAHIPIICLSAGLARGIREGMIADEWLAKPFSSEQLAEALARWVEAPTEPAHSRRAE